MLCSHGSPCTGGRPHYAVHDGPLGQRVYQELATRCSQTDFDSTEAGNEFKEASWGHGGGEVCGVDMS